MADSAGGGKTLYSSYLPFWDISGEKGRGTEWLRGKHDLWLNSLAVSPPPFLRPSQGRENGRKE